MPFYARAFDNYFEKMGENIFSVSDGVGIHSKSEKVCGTAFSVKKKCVKSA